MAKEIADQPMDGQDALGLGHRLESPHMGFTLVDGAPEVLPLPADGDEEFVEMPGVADAAMTSPEAPGVGTAEGVAPGPDGFVSDGDAGVCEEVLDLAEPETEPAVEPDGVAADDRREPIARIAKCVVGHPVTVPALGSS